MEAGDQGRTLRAVMSRFPTGVTVVAAVDAQGAPFGFTVNSFTSVSLDPPLVLVCVDINSSSHAPLMAADHFTVNILGADQSHVADRFASEPSDGRFEAVAWGPSEHGAPLIEGASAWLECSRHEVLPGGDHSILLGRVESVGEVEGAELLFHRGGYGSTAP